MAVATQPVNFAMGKRETAVRIAFLFLCVLSGVFASGQDATITDAQCVHGFVNVTNPNITTSQHISEGFYLFPTAMFTCNGRIVGFQARAYFKGIEENDKYYYNETLVLNLQFWKEEQGHYAAPVRNHTLSLATKGIATGRPSGTYPGKYFFRESQLFQFSNRLDEAIEVEAGDVLAVYLPPTTNEVPKAINSIPLVIADSPGIRAQSPTPCWSPKGQIVCHPVLPFTGVPLLSFEFERSPVVNVSRATPINSKSTPQDRVEDTEQTDTEQTDTEQTDTEQADTEQADTEQADTEQADTEQTGTEQAEEVLGSRGIFTVLIAVSAVLAVLFLLSLLVIATLCLCIVRLNKQMDGMKGRQRDRIIPLPNVRNIRYEQANNPVYGGQNGTDGYGVVYEDIPALNVTPAPAPVVTAFANSNHYSSLQRDTPALTEPSTAPTTGDAHDNVEAYGSLDNTEQYMNSAVELSVPTSMVHSSVPTSMVHSSVSEPTMEQRERLVSQDSALSSASGGEDVHASSSGQGAVVIDGEFWSPGATEDVIYGQMSQNNYQELPRSSVHLGEALGAGEFGDVYRGEWQSTTGCMEVAVKVSKASLKPNERVKLLQEAAVMGQFLHPHVVRLCGVITLGEPYMMVMECLANGNLLKHLLDLNERSPKDPDLPNKLLQFCLEIADGMSYLSKKGFIHRDLAARNILLDKDWRCKISDFGMSRDVSDEYFYNVSGGRIPLCWTAPEAVLYKRYTSKSDVWSYGMVMYEIWSLGHKPFEDMSVDEIIKVLASGFCLPPPPGCTRGVYLLMVECWNPNPAERPDFAKLMSAFLGNPSLLLKWTEEDLGVSPEASMLGAPLEEGKGLYTTLQLKYKCTEAE